MWFGSVGLRCDKIIDKKKLKSRETFNKITVTFNFCISGFSLRPQYNESFILLLKHGPFIYLSIETVPNPLYEPFIHSNVFQSRGDKKPTSVVCHLKGYQNLSTKGSIAKSPLKR